MSDFSALQIQGRVATPGDSDWDQARLAWNLAADQRPEAVVFAESAGDVAATVAFAAANGLRVGAQGTGHGAAPLPPLDGTILLKTERMAGSYELYAEVLRRTIVKVAGELGWEVEPSRAQFLPNSVAYWLPFREANAAMDRLGKKYEIGIITNTDDKLLGISRRHLRTELDLVVTAQQVRSYKPDPVHFKECARRIGGKKGWLHIGSNYATDVAPVLKMNVPVIWVNRHGEKLEGRKAPSATVKNFRDAAKKLGAG